MYSTRRVVVVAIDTRQTHGCPDSTLDMLVQVAGGSMLGAEDDPKQAKIGLNVCKSPITADIY